MSGVQSWLFIVAMVNFGLYRMGFLKGEALVIGSVALGGVIYFN